MSRSPLDAARLAQVVVAVDGPSGSGKSTVSRQVAADLGLRYLDTGAMYRAVTWSLLEHDVDLTDTEAIAAAAAHPVLTVGTDPSHPTIDVDGIDVAGPIRGEAVTAAVSAVSAVPSVRARMAALQRQAIGRGGIVVEGRDIGTVIAPDADVKVYLTASEQARAIRRAAEHSASEDVSLTAAVLRRRDGFDSSRAVSPLRKADDAVEIDATDLTLAEVVAAVTALVLEWCQGDGRPQPSGIDGSKDSVST